MPPLPPSCLPCLPPLFCVPHHHHHHTAAVCRYAVGVFDKRTNTLQLAKPAGGSVSSRTKNKARGRGAGGYSVCALTLVTVCSVLCFLPPAWYVPQTSYCAYSLACIAAETGCVTHAIATDTLSPPSYNITHTLPHHPHSFTHPPTLPLFLLPGGAC